MPGDAASPAAGLPPMAAAAFAHLAATAEAVTEVQVELSELAAPTGGESRRAEAVAHWLRTTGCAVSLDAVGNVVATRRGEGAGGAVVLSAHLDTVFSAEQAVTVAREGEADPYRPGQQVPAGELRGPGIADDAAGLAALVAVAQALAVSATPTERDVIFLATVGEEGRGDLRGARHFFAERAADVSAFITIDHPDPSVIVHRGVGSRRYAVEFRGPGGHAWGHFGRYNPVLALAEASVRLAESAPLNGPRTTYNLGVVSAGRAVNAIPESARMEVDLRSEDADQLARLDQAFHEAMAAGHTAELARHPSGGASFEVESIGARPAGETAVDAKLVQVARRALEAEGYQPRLTMSSTDANAGMAAGVPSICLSWGGRSDNQHSLREFFAPAGRERSLAVILRVVLEVAGVADHP